MRCFKIDKLRHQILDLIYTLFEGDVKTLHCHEFAVILDYNQTASTLKGRMLSRSRPGAMLSTIFPWSGSYRSRPAVG